jgi:thiol-disulfide isomerase/thioredoxin
VPEIQVMKYLFTAIILAALVSCGGSKQATVKQPNYTVVPDDRTKVLRGYINRSIIENDTTFHWFKDNMKWGQADASAIQSFSTNKDKFSMLVFGGTWCGDTKNLWPIFYRLVDKSGYPENKITLVAVDRAKTTIDDLQKKWNITNVPTFIVLHNGKEVGRVIEYGKDNQIDKELGEIVASIK